VLLGRRTMLAIIVVAHHREAALGFLLSQLHELGRSRLALRDGWLGLTLDDLDHLLPLQQVLRQDLVAVLQLIGEARVGHDHLVRNLLVASLLLVVRHVSFQNLRHLLRLLRLAEERR